MTIFIIRWKNGYILALPNSWRIWMYSRLQLNSRSEKTTLSFPRANWNMLNAFHSLSHTHNNNINFIHLNSLSKSSTFQIRNRPRKTLTLHCSRRLHQKFKETDYQFKVRRISSCWYVSLKDAAAFFIAIVRY